MRQLYEYYDCKKEIFQRNFLLQNIDNYNDSSPNDKFSWNEATSHGTSDNVMDRWIISFTQSLLLFVKKEMAAYRLYTVLPRLAYTILQLH